MNKSPYEIDIRHFGFEWMFLLTMFPCSLKRFIVKAVEEKTVSGEVYSSINLHKQSLFVNLRAE